MVEIVTLATSTKNQRWLGLNLLNIISGNYSRNEHWLGSRPVALYREIIRERQGGWVSRLLDNICSFVGLREGKKFDAGSPSPTYSCHAGDISRYQRWLDSPRATFTSDIYPRPVCRKNVLKDFAKYIYFVFVLRTGPGHVPEG